MKTSLLFFISVLLCISSNFLPILAADAPEPVVVGGKKLRAGVPYHVVGADINGNPTGNEGVTFFILDSTTSPVEVEGPIGTPIVFYPVNSKKGVLRVSTDLNVKFWDTTEVWKLDPYDKATRQYFISTGGVVGNPGRQTLSNWFKLEKYGNAYKFMYCPSVCPNCKVICKDVGIFMKDGHRRLALSHVPFLVTFYEHSDE